MEIEIENQAKRLVTRNGITMGEALNVAIQMRLVNALEDIEKRLNDRL